MRCNLSGQPSKTACSKCSEPDHAQKAKSRGTVQFPTKHISSKVALKNRKLTDILLTTTSDRQALSTNEQNIPLRLGVTEPNRLMEFMRTSQPQRCFKSIQDATLSIIWTISKNHTWSQLFIHDEMKKILSETYKDLMPTAWSKHASSLGQCELWELVTSGYYTIILYY